MEKQIPKVMADLFSSLKEQWKEEPELLELKRVYEAQAARRFPPAPQLRSRGTARTEDKTEFLI